MELFEAAFWGAMLVGFLAVVVPAYWLVSGWWQDRQRRNASSPSPVDPG